MSDAAPLPLTPESLAQALRDVVDGIGGSFTLPTIDGAADLLDSARASGLDVIDVVPLPQLQTVALASLSQALGSFDPLAGIPTFGVDGVSPRLASWLRRRIADGIAHRAASTPVLVLVREPSRVDDTTRGLLPQLIRATTRDAVIWVVGADGPPHPDSADRAPSPRDLSRAQVALLRLVASTPVALTLDELAELTGAEAPRVMVPDLIGRGVLVEFRGGHTLASPGLRDRLVADATPTIRRSLDRAALDVVARREPPAAALAEIALASARPHDVPAARILVAAMDSLRASDPDSAADYGSAAVDLLAHSDEALIDLAWRLLPLLWQTSRIVEARRLAARVFSESGQADAEARTLLWLARFEGSADRAVRYTESALALPEVPEHIRVQLLAVHIRLLSTLGRVGDVDRLLPAALRDAVAAGDHESLSRLQSCDSIRHFYRGAYRTSAGLAEFAEASWSRSGAPRAERMPELIWGPHLTALLGDPTAALAHVDLLLGEFVDHAQTFAVRFLHAERSLILLTMGRLAEASDEVVASTTASERLWSLPPDTSDRLQAIAVSVRLKIALHRGDAGEFDEIRRLLETRIAPVGSEAAARLDWWRFLVDEAQGTTGFAVDPDRLPPVSWLDPSDEVLVARALLTRGHRESADALAAHAAQRVAASDAHPLALTLASHLHGLVHADPGALDAAAEGWRALDRALLAATARSAAGAARAELGEPDGVALQESAHDEFVALGAHREAWLLRGRLRSQGHLLGAERETTGGALTPTERRVVDRALLGLTVGRIATELALSPHTVTTHLRHVYAKLGVTSRAELAAWADRPARRRDV